MLLFLLQMSAAEVYHILAMGLGGQLQMSQTSDGLRKQEKPQPLSQSQTRIPFYYRKDGKNARDVL